MKKLSAILLVSALLFALCGGFALAAVPDYDYSYFYGDPDEVPELFSLDSDDYFFVLSEEGEDGVDFVTVANIYQVSHYDCELLQAVSILFPTPAQGVVNIMTNLTDPELPDSGTLAYTGNVSCDTGSDLLYCELDESIPLQKDSYFSVIFSLIVDEDSEGIPFRNATEDSQDCKSLIVGSDEYWYDCSYPGTDAFNFCITAYTDLFDCTHSWHILDDTTKRCLVCLKEEPRLYAPDHFTDLNSDSAYFDAIQWALENGITTGTSETEFSPSKSCTRGQIVTFLWRAAGSPEPGSTENPFEDVSESSAYYEAILWANENGITTGTDSTHFSPNRACTRAEIVTFLWRAVGEPDPGVFGTAFVDVAVRYYWYVPMLWAVKEGITTGTDSEHFSPNKVCSRAQAVTFLYRASAH